MEEKVLNCEKELRKIARRSLVTNKFIKKGEIIKESSLIPKDQEQDHKQNCLNISKKAKKYIKIK